MSEWKSISTAPTDGAEVLALDERADLNPIFVAHFHEWHWYDRNGRIFMPTHWMPLPPPPEVK